MYAQSVKLEIIRYTIDSIIRHKMNDGRYKGKQIFKKESIQDMLRFQFTKDHTPENVNPEKLNSGLFWATKMGGTRIGHNGSDPGVRTFILSDLDKEVAVILFSNTSLSESEEDKFFDLYNDLYKFGLTIKDTQSVVPNRK
jgi:CubicO group peptidase (beta-lactamase class C family)